MEMYAKRKIAEQEAAAQAIVDAQAAVERGIEEAARLQQEASRLASAAQAKAQAQAKADALAAARAEEKARVAARAAMLARIEQAARAKAEADATLYSDRKHTKKSKYRRPPPEHNDGLQLVQWLNVSSGRLPSVEERPLPEDEGETKADKMAEKLVAALVPCLTIGGAPVAQNPYTPIRGA